jgi:hypothetical protein
MFVLVMDGGGSADHVFQAIINLLIPGQTPGIKEHLVNLYKKLEILFFGPDEGTVDMMDWVTSEFLL